MSILDKVRRSKGKETESSAPEGVPDEAAVYANKLMSLEQQLKTIQSQMTNLKGEYASTNQMLVAYIDEQRKQMQTLEATVKKLPASGQGGPST
jgi:septation ring formation regulator EzrA